MSSLPETRSGPFPIGTALCGRSGRTYNIQEVLAERRKPLLCVYRANGDGKDFIVKDALRGDFEYQQNLQDRLASCPNLRTIVDTIPDFELFVYPFLVGDPLRLSQRPLSEGTRKSILRSALTGLAELHDRGIIHTGESYSTSIAHLGTYLDIAASDHPWQSKGIDDLVDIKPNNILLDYEETASGDVVIQNVKISDLEDSVLLPPGKDLKGCLCGNQLWRSPESWARARQNTPSDVFSFGVVAIYVMLDRMIFLAGLSDEEVTGADAWWHILRRHVSYFATDEYSFKGLLRHVGEDDLWFDRFAALAGDFDAERPRKPLAEWQYVGAGFRDLIVNMTNLDPARRITAREALEHPWLQQTESGQKTLD